MLSVNSLTIVVIVTHEGVNSINSVYVCHCELYVLLYIQTGCPRIIALQKVLRVGNVSTLCICVCHCELCALLYIQTRCPREDNCAARSAEGGYLSTLCVILILYYTEGVYLSTLCVCIV